ncbi:MAG: hypothetical protein GY828_02395 [Candidatus Gracilibacteria bacterium]|nr:hypothetical protein [Candidatus Gracilibacteria bacterium]
MQIIESKNGIIESVDTKHVPEEIYNTINKIRFDCWSYFVEYAYCNDCKKDFLKGDIFSPLDLNYTKKTVTELELEYADQCGSCPNCQNDLVFPWKKTTDDIKDKIENTLGSSLVLYRENKNNSIQGFSLGYVETFANIYKREYSSYFNDHLKNILESHLEKEYITISATCISQPYKNVGIVFDLLKSVFTSFDEKFKKHPATSEYILKSVTEKIYEIMGGERLNLHQKYPHIYKSEIISDIGFQNSPCLQYGKLLTTPLHKVIKNKKNTIKNIRTEYETL